MCSISEVGTFVSNSLVTSWCKPAPASASILAEAKGFFHNRTTHWSNNLCENYLPFSLDQVCIWYNMLFFWGGGATGSFLAGFSGQAFRAAGGSHGFWKGELLPGGEGLIEGSFTSWLFTS